LNRTWLLPAVGCTGEPSRKAKARRTMPPCFISINWHANVSGSAFQQLAGGRNRCTPKMGRTGFWQISEWEEVAEGGARIPGKSAQK
jgi:hypothetical protein